MISKAEAAALIEGRLEKTDRLVVALDGMSCSGKTTFARALAERFSGSVVHMDDFFLPRDRFSEEMQALPGGNMDRDRFKAEVLTPLAAGGDFAYRAFSCSSQSLLPDPVPVTPAAQRGPGHGALPHPLDPPGGSLLRRLRRPRQM